MRKAFKVTTDGKAELLDLDAPEGSLKVLQKAVGGFVEAVDLTPTITMWANEEGKLDGSAPNEFATFLYLSGLGLVDVIMGDVVFTGGTDASGRTMALAEEDYTRLYAEWALF